jgi:hypothetical protein
MFLSIGLDFFEGRWPFVGGSEIAGELLCELTPTAYWFCGKFA